MSNVSTITNYKLSGDYQRIRARRRIVELSKPQHEILDFKVDGSVWRNGKILLEEPSYEQIEWFERRMHGPARNWERWFVGQYFTEQQKKELGLTDKDIEGKGMA